MPKYKIPNLLTITRVILAIVSVLFILPMGFDLQGSYQLYTYKFGYTIFLITIFIVAMATDFIDGYLARK